MTDHFDILSDLKWFVDGARNFIGHGSGNARHTPPMTSGMIFIIQLLILIPELEVSWLHCWRCNHPELLANGIKSQALIFNIMRALPWKKYESQLRHLGGVSDREMEELR